ncbi:DNA polymerase III subunit beta [Eggerthellaceae bacterium zg-1084]|uniref:DNA polymerase III subunit beta n=1 Tax=Berryella wangjianweii TaxID=2734634 RepID=UPI0015543F5A|nr:DNA polymerase III subunit beta [Berryella wangjianweii]NPD30941.1 DNA polymerase III subunit beta [Berryella wangjianweii]NPD31806.1 DNA polymerase III subunit beta [Eggerthellaceae bacterium zg-997]
MKFSIAQSELARALSIVQKGAQSRSTLPILSGIYLEASGDEVLFQTTDLELSIQFKVVAMVEEVGCAVLPAKLAVDIVKSLPDAAVHVSTEGDTTTITCDNSSFSVKGLDPVDWPGFPSVNSTCSIEVPFDVFAGMAKRVAGVVSRDESRPVLMGVLVSVEDGALKMVATDSYRLSCTQQPCDNLDASFSAVVAGSFIQELASLPRSKEPIVLGLTENQIVVSYQGTSFVNRRIEGNYPNYRQLIPSAHTTRAQVDASALSAAVKRASIMGHTGSSVRFSVSPDAQAITVSAVAQDVGSIQEMVPAQVEGDAVEIGFNSSYVIDGLGASATDTVSFELQGSMKPGVLRTADQGDYLYLIMPVRLS